MSGPQVDYLERPELTRLQTDRLARILDEILPRQAFSAGNSAPANVPPADIRSLADLARLPFTTKAELLADQEASPPYGNILTYPLSRYRRVHQTSGTTGQPLRWLDTSA